MDYGQYLATLGEGIVRATNKKIFSLSFSKDFSLSLSLCYPMHLCKDRAKTWNKG